MDRKITASELRTCKTRREGRVLFVDILAPPMNLLGVSLVRDLVTLIQEAEADENVQVLVFRSADTEYFISHVDVTEVDQFRKEAARLAGEASLGLLFRRLSSSRLVTLAQISGRVRGAGSEFVLACDMRFAAVETALFSQPEIAFGLLPGAGAIPHLVRIAGRGRALEIMLSGADYNASEAAQYGWINRAMPDAQLESFVTALAHRIARFPSPARALIKERVNALSLPSTDEIQADSAAFIARIRAPSTQARVREAFSLHGFQTAAGELAMSAWLEQLGSEPPAREEAD